MKIKIWNFAFALVFVFSAALPAMSAQWQETELFSYPVSTFAWSDANVYAEPDVNSEIVGQLKENNTSDEDEWDVFIVQIRITEWGEWDQPMWARISKPVEGWVQYGDLGLSNSGFIGEILEADDFHDAEE